MLDFTAEATKNNYFIKAVAQPILDQNGETDIDDVYLKFGQKKWDLQLGRFEAMESFVKGNDTVIEHAGGEEVSVYEGDYLFGRIDDAIHTAFHFNPSDHIKLELGIVAKQHKNSDGTKTSLTGIRPAISYSVNKFEFVGSIEQMKEKDTSTNTTSSGIGMSFIYKYNDNGVVTLALASSSVDNGSENDTKTQTVGLNIEHDRFGAGVIRSETDTGLTGEKPNVNTIHASYEMPLFGRDDASITFAASTSKADNISDEAPETFNAFTTRFAYEF